MLCMLKVVSSKKKKGSKGFNTLVRRVNSFLETIAMNLK